MTTKQDWLPNDYEAPKQGSDYFKSEDGDNKIRILTTPIIGFEYFSTENKPVRSKTMPTDPKDIKEDGKVKEFWSFVIWNYSLEKLQVMTITQSSIKKQLMSLIQDADFGDPREYDLKINKSGKDLETEYIVKALGKSAFFDTNIMLNASIADLNLLYTGGHPLSTLKK